MSVVLFTHSAAAERHCSDAVSACAEMGFPAPQRPASFAPTVQESKFINPGMQLAITAYRLMCESTVDMANDTMVPGNVEEDLAMVDGAKQILATRPLHFLHRSV